MPAALVAIGWNSPRYSAGALGFMSQVSICDAPPLSQMRIVDLAFFRPPLAAGAAFTRLGKCRPQNPRPLATRNVRRSTGPVAKRAGGGISFIAGRLGTTALVVGGTRPPEYTVPPPTPPTANARAVQVAPTRAGPCA